MMQRTNNKHNNKILT